MTKRKALISVSDKTGLIEFAKTLCELDIEIVSTGGTKQYLEESGIKTTAVESITGFSEMMDGRVKTLHPAIHGALLARRDKAAHLKDLQAHNIQLIDFVCVNLYPFKQTILKEGVGLEEAIENIDIGGPSMLRSAAKNYASVTVIVDPNDYPIVAKELLENQQTTLETRAKLGAKVFRHTAAYDAVIANYLTHNVAEKNPELLVLPYERKQVLRYGENSHQQATFYKNVLPDSYSIACCKQLHGKELSYNNIRDADAAIRIVREFVEPTVVALKHMNPCGIGTGATIFDAYIQAYTADPVSIFGGIVVCNRTVDLPTAKKMHALFLEIIIAPDYTAEALACLEQKKNVRILKLDFSQDKQAIETEKTGVLGGMLVQEQDSLVEEVDQWVCVTKRKPTKEEQQALVFAYKAVKYVKSNAIVVTNATQTLGIGAGQMNRVGSVKIALEQAKDNLIGAVLASDAFFPMSDSVEYAALKGIRAIIQPGGSIRDQESIEMADKYGVTMLFTNVRHFRH